MRHHTAAPLSDRSGWHYASVHPRRGGYPLGYCAEHEPHSTESEARRCYRKYERDQIRLDIKFSDWAGCKVEGCDAPTKTGAQHDGYHLVALCEEHLTREYAQTALGLDEDEASDSWQS